MVKYTTATLIRSWLAENVVSVHSDSELEAFAEYAEGIIDTWLKLGSGTGANSLTYDNSKVPHRVLRLAATAMAASVAMATSSPSFGTMEQALVALEVSIYWWEQAERMLKEHEYADFIMEQ